MDSDRQATTFFRTPLSFRTRSPFLERKAIGHRAAASEGVSMARSVGRSLLAACVAGALWAVALDASADPNEAPAE